MYTPLTRYYLKSHTLELFINVYKLLPGKELYQID